MARYLEQIEQRMKEWIDEQGIDSEGMDRYDFIDCIVDNAWNEDSVTGNMTGSYFCSRYKAYEMLISDESVPEYISQMCYNGELSYEQLGKWIAEQNYEAIDVAIRCHLLPDVASHIAKEWY